MAKMFVVPATVRHDTQQNDIQLNDLIATLNISHREHTVIHH